MEFFLLGYIQILCTQKTENVHLVQAEKCCWGSAYLVVLWDWRDKK